MSEEELLMLEGLEKEVSEINHFLKSPYDTTADALQERLSFVNAYNARTGEMLAQAEYLLAKEKGEVLGRLLKDNPKMSATGQKICVESECAYPIKVVRLIERCNRATVHAGEANITQAYCEKENMSLTRKGY